MEFGGKLNTVLCSSNTFFYYYQYYYYFFVVFQIRKSLVEITALPIYDVRLIRDKLTNTSRGFCFVELGSVEVT